MHLRCKVLPKLLFCYIACIAVLLFVLLFELLYCFVFRTVHVKKITKEMDDLPYEIYARVPF